MRKIKKIMMVAMSMILVAGMVMPCSRSLLISPSR